MSETPHQEGPTREAGTPAPSEPSAPEVEVNVGDGAGSETTEGSPAGGTPASDAPASDEGAQSAEE